MTTPQLRLASSSSTRAALLDAAGVSFLQSAVDFNEDAVEAQSAKAFVYQATWGKYTAALKRYGYETLPLLVADTVISVDDRILRKAASLEDARRILLLQSGATVSIVTCMIYRSSTLELVDLSATHYRFAPFDHEDLERYLQSGAWQGKAGACMVEGFCKPYIQEVHGFESCAMGLSIEVLKIYI